MAVKQHVRALVPAGLRKRLLMAKYAGDNQECPCCNRTFSTFWPSGETANSMRPNSMCPNCGSLERHRLLWLYLQANRALVFDGAKVLHIAPEPIVTDLLHRLGEIDYLSADLEATRASVKMDITDIQFPRQSFDIIICYHVLEHVRDDRKAMRELRRVLRPNGWALLQSPLKPGLQHTFEDQTIVEPEARERAFGQKDHVRLYGRDYGNRLREAGWDVESLNFSATLSCSDIRRFSVDPCEELYLCH